VLYGRIVRIFIIILLYCVFIGEVEAYRFVTFRRGHVNTIVNNIIILCSFLFYLVFTVHVSSRLEPIVFTTTACSCDGGYRLYILLCIYTNAFICGGGDRVRFLVETIYLSFKHTTSYLCMCVCIHLYYIMYIAGE